jgi:hypothetical protein
MKKISAFILLFSLLLFASCANGALSLKEYVGVWVMDQGAEAYINQAGFEIQDTGKGFVLLLGDIENGAFTQREKPAPLVKKEKGFAAEIAQGSSLTIQPDKNGLRLLGFSGETKSMDFHFKRLDTLK